MNDLPPIMFAHMSVTDFVWLIGGVIWTVLWIILEVYLVFIGGYGVLKRALKKRDAYRIGAVTISFTLASLALFHWCGFLPLNFSLLYKLAVIPGALGLATIIRFLLTGSPAEPAGGANGSQPSQSQTDGASSAAGSHRSP